MTQPTNYGSAGMRAAVGHFSTAVSECDTAASNVDTVAVSLHGHWVGEASTTYRRAVDEWQTHWNTCRKALAEMHQILQQTNQTYDQTHNTTLDAAASTQSAMSGLAGFTL